jgi:hypothetical protein
VQIVIICESETLHIVIEMCLSHRVNYHTKVIHVSYIILIGICVIHRVNYQSSL